MTTTMTPSTSQFTHASNGMFFFPEPSTALDSLDVGDFFVKFCDQFFAK